MYLTIYIYVIFCCLKLFIKALYNSIWFVYYIIMCILLARKTWKNKFVMTIIKTHMPFLYDVHFMHKQNSYTY